MTDIPDSKILETKLLLRPDEVARILSVSKMTVYRLCQRGELHAIRIRNNIRVKTDSVKAFLEMPFD